MVGKPSIRGDVNVALNRLVRERVLKSFKTNFDARHISGWMPEISIMIPRGANLAEVLEQVDAAVRSLGPVMVAWEHADEDPLDDRALFLVHQKH